MNQRDVIMLAILCIFAVIRFAIAIPRWRREKEKEQRIYKEFDDMLSDEQKEAIRRGKAHRR